MINNNTIIKKNTNIATNELDEQVVMMNIETGKYYSFDKTGTEIWYHLDDQITFDELVTKLMSNYNVERNTCENDTREFLVGLVKNKLITLI